MGQIKNIKLHIVTDIKVEKMGAGDSKDLAALLNDPKLASYSKSELKKWEERFNERYPTGFVTEQEFRKLYEKAHPGKDAGTLARHIYRLFDDNNDNKVSFKEFMVAVSVSCRGTMREKLKWMFDLFDLD